VPSDRFVLVRFTVVAREGGLPAGAKAEVEVDPRAVARWRRIGATSGASGGAGLDAGAPRAEAPAAAGAAHAVSTVYALELRSGVAPSATVAMLRLRWRSPAGE